MVDIMVERQLMVNSDDFNFQVKVDDDDPFKIIVHGWIRPIIAVKELSLTDEFKEYLISIGVDPDQFMHELFLEFEKEYNK